MFSFFVFVRQQPKGHPKTKTETVFSFFDFRTVPAKWFPKTKIDFIFSMLEAVTARRRKKIEISSHLVPKIL
jgi:hypothetical protein